MKNYRLGVGGADAVFVWCTPAEIGEAARAVRKRTRQRVKFSEFSALRGMPNDPSMWMARRDGRGMSIYCYSSANYVNGPVVSPAQLASGELPLAAIGPWLVRIVNRAGLGGRVVAVGCKRIRLDRAVGMVAAVRKAKSVEAMTTDGSVVRVMPATGISCTSGETATRAEFEVVARVVDMAAEAFGKGRAS